MKFNIPEDEAVERLVDLIKEHDRWIEAPLDRSAAGSGGNRGLTQPIPASLD